MRGKHFLSVFIGSAFVQTLYFSDFALQVSLAGAFNILLSTLISVSLHEFGHATAAARWLSLSLFRNRNAICL